MGGSEPFSGLHTRVRPSPLSLGESTNVAEPLWPRQGWEQGQGLHLWLGASAVDPELFLGQLL